LKMSATVGDSMSLDGKDQTKSVNEENGTREEFKDDKLARSDVECFVLDDYFVPKQDEHLIRAPMKQEDKKPDKKEQKKKRPVFKINMSERLCNTVVDLAPGEEIPECSYQGCKMQHDIQKWLSTKPPDVGKDCYVFQQFGYCPRGLTCRYASVHLDDNGRNIRNNNNLVPAKIYTLDKQDQINLRKKKYDFSYSDSVCQKSWDLINYASELAQNKLSDNSENLEPPEKKMKENEEEKEKKKMNKPLGPVSDEDLVKMRKSEKKVLDWKGKTYLAPLTTVGNLPFRRVCKNLGVDITCGEMALGLQLLQGHGAEWALTKKHESEDFFGVQVCGCSPPQMARVAQLLEEKVDCDFVDINMGCPIDLIYQKGMGSGLMARKRPLENIVRTMSTILNKPLTIKMRNGIYSEKRIAHDVFPLVEKWGVSAITIHGRSREQRYTKLADWSYIGDCVKTVNVPVFGNGDIMNYEDYNYAMKTSQVSGIMLARGALIKPWLFTEIKEQRHWDISGQERLDIIKQFCNYGLEHWGSDDKGVENTRKFLLEWLSFTHRYVPHGILMFPPQKINQRIPIYKGRNELETLLSSPSSQDWIKISEMFLGKVRDDFLFVPKHKAHAY